MQPLRDLLNRIKWDPAFGKDTFALGYVDRVARREEIIAFRSIALDPGGSSFSVQGDDGVTVHIPLHRVRHVFKNGMVIWRRPDSGSGS